jgi:hypothetical protein
MYNEPGSSVSIVSGYGLTTERLRFNPWQRQKVFSSRLGGPPSLLYSGFRGPFPLAKVVPGCDVDHSAPSGAKVENE